MTTERYGFTDRRYDSFPPVVQIALVSGVCPSNCLYCPVGQKNKGELPQKLADELKVGYFDYRLFCKVADEMARYPWTLLRLHSRGEPMVHDRYFDMIAYAKRQNVLVTGFTNGILLKSNGQQLLESGMDMLEVSADAPNAELYQRWRRNEHFQEIVDGVRLLHSARQAAGARRPRIVVSAVDHPEFRPAREEFFTFWSPICDKVIVRPFHTYAGRIADPYQDSRGHRKHVPCVQLWERFSVSYTGLVNACFNDWGDHEIVGDVRRQSIADIWRSKPFEQIRAKALEAPCLDCCNRCSGPSLSSWGKEGYQHWVTDLLGRT